MMQTETYDFLQRNPKLANFVRYNPVWYRNLTREPHRINELEYEAKKFYGKTFPQQIEKFGNHLQTVDLLIQFAGMMKD